MTIYKTPERFVAEAGGDWAAPLGLLQTRELQRAVAGVLGHAYKTLRIRYWRAGDDATIWVLAEVGREEDITIGFVVRGDAIERTEVLEFRESRGWQIRMRSFTQQFTGARLAADGELDRPIDGITGATLSVDAYHRLARLALLLHRQVAAPR
ncbi:MAG: FMN-binding protein [Lautropia sp.]